MIQLALETTGRNGSLAVLDGESVLWKRRLGLRLRTAAELAVELKSALQWCGDESFQIRAISVAVGPGSFTGLRIAVTTAKTLAYALQLPVVSVGSLAAIAAVTATQDPVANVLVGLNAYRRQVFAAEFSLQELQESHGINRCNDRAMVLSQSDWELRVARATRQPDWAVTGDSAIFTPEQVESLSVREQPDAVGVGRIAARWIAGAEGPEGDGEQPSGNLPPGNSSEASSGGSPFTDPFALVARYLRPSAAEEKASSR